MKVSQEFNSGWMDKQNVIYAWKGIAFNPTRKEIMAYESWGHYAKWNKPITKRKVAYDFMYISIQSSQNLRDEK